MNDAKGCYSRIDHNFSILVLMFFGIPGRLLGTVSVIYNKEDTALRLATAFRSQSMVMRTQRNQ